MLLQISLPEHDFERKAFADLLKESAMRSLGLDRSHADDFKTRARITVAFGDNEPVVELSGRQFLQLYGLEAHREVFGESFWTDRVLTSLDETTTTVITDVRLDDEAEAIRALGGQVWHIERPGLRIAESRHATEQGVDDALIDRRIENSGELHEFGALLRQEFLCQP